MKKCRRASDKLDTLRLNDDKLDGFDSLLGYALKYMRNLKHFDLSMTETTALSSDLLESFLKAYQGKLETFQWIANGISRDGIVDTTKGGKVWSNLRGLDVLVMIGVSFDKSSDLVNVIAQQQSSLQSLGLGAVALGKDRYFWSRNDCRTISRSISLCKNIVHLELEAISLRDSDVEIFLPHLTSLRILRLLGYPECVGHLTDKCCKLISRTCLNLQELNIRYQRNITVSGVRRLFKGCPCLRSIVTSAKLQPADVVTLVREASALVHFATEMTFDEPTHRNMVEATNGQTLLTSFFGDHDMANMDGLSNGTQENYKRAHEIVMKVVRRLKDRRIINAWECPEVDEILMMRAN